MWWVDGSCMGMQGLRPQICGSVGGLAAPGPSGRVSNAVAGRSSEGSPQDHCGCRKLVQDHRVSPQTSALSSLLSLFLALDMLEIRMCAPPPPSVMFITLHSGLTSLLIHL